MTPGTTLYWFRQDLRLHDNPAMRHSAQTSERLLPVYVHDTKHDQVTPWGFQRLGAHRRTFLRGALDGLSDALTARGSRLIEHHGDTPRILIHLCKTLNAARIVCEEIVAPEEQDDVNTLREAGISIETIWQSTMLSANTLPWDSAAVPDVFTAFRQGIEKQGIRFDACEPDLSSLPKLPVLPDDTPHLVRTEPQRSPVANWQQASFPYPLAGFSGCEKDALAYLESYFQSDRPAQYKATRNGLSGVDYSTKFSPWLALGALSPRRIMQRLTEYESEHGQNDGSYWIWFELLWRDHFRWLHHKYGRRLYRKEGLRVLHPGRKGKGVQPKTQPLHRQSTSSPHLSMFPEKEHNMLPALERWMTGTTGHPFVDAGMRELLSTGYLSNRMRQIVASYLIHDLGVDWRAGAAWFESQLIDYDVYSNQGNWAYIAGVGTDPRGGRRFNPDKQAAEHDPTGAYQQQWGTR